MSTNNIDGVREHLFAVLEGLTNKEAPMDIERAKAVCDTAQTIINTAKVEVEYIRATGGGSQSNFMAALSAPGTTPEKPGQTVEHRENGLRVVTHRMRG